MSFDTQLGWLAAGAALFLTTSCASEQGAPSEARGSLTERLSGGSPFVFSQDAEGNWKAPQSGKRSEFESGERDNSMFKGEYAGKQYAGTEGEVQKRAWWGTKQDVAKPEFSGADEASGLVKASGWQGQENSSLEVRARESSNRFATNGYATKAAREVNSERLGRPIDAQTEARRRNYPQPDIISWEEQRSMSLGETKRLLGGN
jgi:hypothetical protein